MSQWQGKVAVITGAASGIGAGLVRYCVSQDMHVVAADVDAASLATLAQELQGRGGGSVRALTVDVTDQAQLEGLAAEVFEQFGAVHLLFNNAGVLVDGKSWERSARDWRWSLDVNVMGVVHGIRAFVPRMLAQGSPGRVVNTSSIGGLLGGGAFMALYQGTKHMITAITESLYQELEYEASPVTASVLCPGEVATGIFNSDRLRPEEERNTLGSPEEQQLHDAVAGGVQAGLDPDEFAARVFAGIEAGRFWLLPQPEFKPMLERRNASILDETNPVSMSELIGLR